MLEKPYRLGIIDDDQVYQLILKKTFERTQPGKSVLQFFNGEEAIDFFKSCTIPVHELPDVLLVDINMPYMNGWQFLEALELLSFAHEYNPDIHIISSSPANEDIALAHQYRRVTSYIVKPITKDKLASIIAKA
ncbi:Response regulator receiver domain-containing protein [Filimonas lacunae]|uniref:Response regulator receiver domain-containing protein n=1 Tax=Filimonas lacunae TaxID=477680 RepID=A0A173M9J5_9BACT|nr:response regulator [Filimonas lacunae]BAV04192.1 two-component response regulator [Filimonas lacunae]SIT14414.1 Response regulator receiver domain-containing protein [Filimonas lacunae]